MQSQGQTTVVYLGGFGRSGSTLVERVLGAAPGWVNVGELVDLARSVAPADELCGCGVPFSQCPLWTAVGEVAFGGWSKQVLGDLVSHHREAARQRNLPRLLAKRDPASASLTALRDAYTKIYRAVAEVTGAKVIVDASKGPALGQAIAGAPGIDLRMLNLVRDPRAVSWSWSRHVTRPHDASGTDEMWRIPASRAAIQWGALQLEMAAIAKFGGVPSARLRYEDFIDDPLASLTSATAALGLPLQAEDLPELQGSQITLQPSHGLSGNPSRFRSGQVELRRDERWASQMSTRDRTVVTTLTLPLLMSYRYVGDHHSKRGQAGRTAERDRPDERTTR